MVGGSQFFMENGNEPLLRYLRTNFSNFVLDQLTQLGRKPILGFSWMFSWPASPGVTPLSGKKHNAGPKPAKTICGQALDRSWQEAAPMARPRCLACRSWCLLDKSMRKNNNCVIQWLEDNIMRYRFAARPYDMFVAVKAKFPMSQKVAT